MTPFVCAYVLGFILWKAQGNSNPWLLLTVFLIVTAWALAYLWSLRRHYLHRARHRLHRH